MHMDVQDKSSSYRMAFVVVSPFNSLVPKIMSQTKRVGLFDAHKESNMANCGKPQEMEPSPFMIILSPIPQGVGATKDEDSYLDRLALQKPPAALATSLIHSLAPETLVVDVCTIYPTVRGIVKSVHILLSSRGPPTYFPSSRSIWASDFPPQCYDGVLSFCSQSRSTSLSCYEAILSANIAM